MISDYSRPVFSGCSLLGGASWRSRTAQPEKVPGGVFARDCFECWLPVCVGGTVCVCVSVCVCARTRARACVWLCARLCVFGRVSLWACVPCACTWRLPIGRWLKHCSPYLFFLFVYPSRPRVHRPSGPPLCEALLGFRSSVSFVFFRGSCIRGELWDWLRLAGALSTSPTAKQQLC